MELHTYTSLWNVDKRIYKLYDFTLPVPIGVRQLGSFMLTAIVWCTLLGTVNFPFSSPWHVVWVAPPAMIAWAAGKPLIEGKRMGDLVVSNARYAAQSGEYARLQPCTAPVAGHVNATVWVPAGKPVPVPGPGTPVHDLITPRPALTGAHL